MLKAVRGPAKDLHLVIADPTSTSSKAVKARKLGTNLITEADLEAMIAEKAGRRRRGRGREERDLMAWGSLGYPPVMERGAAVQHERPTTAGIAGDEAAERARFVAAVERGLADVVAGRVVDDEELGRELDEEIGPLP